MSTPEERAARVMACETVDELKELLRPTRERREMHERAGTRDPSEFSLTMGNPPYQKEGAPVERGQVQPTSIFHYFQDVASVISRATVMIYPGGRWMQQGGKGMKEFGRRQMNDPHLVKLEYYPKKTADRLFPLASIADGVSIVMKSVAKTTPGFCFNGIKVDAPGDRILPITPTYIPVVKRLNEWMDENDCQTVNEGVEALRVYSIESSFAEDFPELVFSCSEHEYPPAEINRPVRLLTNNKAGKAGRPAWFFMDRDNLPTGHHMVDRWQVVIKSAQFPHETNQWARSIIIGKGEAHGRVKASIADFATREEAENFQQYMRTKLCTKLYLESINGALSNICAFVPNLKGYTDDNPLFKSDMDLGRAHEYFGLSLNNRLYKLFGLNEAEIAVIENSAS